MHRAVVFSQNIQNLKIWHSHLLKESSSITLKFLHFTPLVPRRICSPVIVLMTWLNHSNRCFTFKPVLGVSNLFLSLSRVFSIILTQGLKLRFTGCQYYQKSGVSDQILRTGCQWVTRLFFHQPFNLKAKQHCLWMKGAIYLNRYNKPNQLFFSQQLDRHIWFSSFFI